MTSLAIKIYAFQTMYALLLVDGGSWHYRQCSCWTFNFTHFTMNTVSGFIADFLEMAYKYDVFGVYSTNFQYLAIAILL